MSLLDQKYQINTRQLTKTKIVATLGPASSSNEVLEDLIIEGVDVFRLNFSHGSIEEKTDLFNRLRSLSTQFMDQVSILCDIQGPKIRTGVMKEAFELVVGDVVKVTPDKLVGSKEDGFQIKYEQMLEDLGDGDTIFINDGIVKLQVVGREDRFLVCEVLAGGTVSDKKGCNIPSGKLSVNIITPKDEVDLEAIAGLSPDFLAVSFVGSADDIHKVRSTLEGYGNTSIRLIAKIERPSAVENIDAIIEASDGIMVARGDLGVEIDTWLVPIAQKDICKKCNQAGKPVIVATQMLESMTQSSRPTRAEANDVFNAVLDGADAVMLSGETSVGINPPHVVKTMDTIIQHAEQHIITRNATAFGFSLEDIMAHSILQMALKLEKEGKAGKIVVYASKSTKFTRKISKYRPPMDIISYTHKAKAAHKLNIQWGVRAVLLTDPVDMTDYKDKVKQTANSMSSLGLIEDAEYIIFAYRTSEGAPSLILFSREQYLNM
eukprot:TRINITY_DN761_c0_g1_i1.p1 TRINITY_DN761_c0_g1~~TRINITY_DN761_c0_g1_i1.p1  ORF type:complete len:498 (-),score=120.98 TRINITY_DN761_c0_g1_i1:7-1479(-)